MEFVNKRRVLKYARQALWLLSVQSDAQVKSKVRSFWLFEKIDLPVNTKTSHSRFLDNFGSVSGAGDGNRTHGSSLGS